MTHPFFRGLANKARYLRLIHLLRLDFVHPRARIGQKTTIRAKNFGASPKIIPNLYGLLALITHIRPHSCLFHAWGEGGTQMFPGRHLQFGKTALWAAMCLPFLVTSPAQATGTLARTPIENTATASYDDGGSTVTVDSSTVSLIVDTSPRPG